MKRPRSAIALLILLGALPFDASGQGTVFDLPRQYYSDNWERSPGKQYYFRRYYYRKAPTDDRFEMHYVIWYPSRPGHYFYYNPAKATYWCRALSQARPGLNIWQVLDSTERSRELADVSTVTWDSKQMTHPPIPGSSDGTLMEPPPVLETSNSL